MGKQQSDVQERATLHREDVDHPAVRGVVDLVYEAWAQFGTVLNAKDDLRLCVSR
jgi:hypothetical protein